MVLSLSYLGRIMHRKRFIIKRFLQLIPVMFGVTILVYALMYLSPGDPAQRKLTSGGVAVNQEVLDKVREEMGLNDTFLVQYGRWLKAALHGNLGISYKDGLPVTTKLIKGLKNTAVLSFSAFLLAVLISVPLGIYSALRQNKAADYLIRFFSFLGNSLPSFLLSVLLMYYLCIKTKVFPVMAEKNLKGMFLPVLTLALPIISRFIRQIRAEILEQLHCPYVFGSRARGVSEWFIIVRNVLYNSLSGILTVFGLTIGSLMSGSVVVETIFMWPGVGKLVMDSIIARDYPVIQGFVLLMAFIYVLVNLCTDLCYQRLEPRIREEQG